MSGKGSYRIGFYFSIEFLSCFRGIGELGAPPSGEQQEIHVFPRGDKLSLQIHLADAQIHLTSPVSRIGVQGRAGSSSGEWLSALRAAS